jgi:Tn3 transposase DDE domain
LEPEPEPASLLDLRKAVEAMLPRVDLPEVLLELIVTDTASYSDIVFGLLTLAGFAYAPQLADLPDQKMWRIDRTADYGAFTDAARGRVDLARIERQWEDILRIIGSIHTGAVRAYDVIRMLSRDGRSTPLGDAIAHYGRIAKSLHILRLADEPGYRRQIKAQANLQEGRHALARKIFHGKYGQLYQRYQDGMEDQLGALGLVLNALVLFNTRYMDAAVTQLRADGFDVRDEDVARLSPFVRHHITIYLDDFRRAGSVSSDRQERVRRSRRGLRGGSGSGRRWRCVVRPRGASRVRQRPGRAAVHGRAEIAGGVRSRSW